MNPFRYFLFLAAALICSCSSPEAPPYNTGYDFSRPDATLLLPDSLHEISDLVVIDSVTAACVQDENGILFIYDFSANRIASRISFHLDGDYEGIARLGRTIYILRSDGVLFELPDYETNEDVKRYVTGMPAENSEGLCPEPGGKRLLIASKSKSDAGKDQRPIYAFDLATHQLSEDPVFDLDVDDIRDFAEERGIETDKKIKLRTSAIAFHPLTGELFLLSAADHLLLILDSDGAPRHIELLDPELFNKPEGISFLPNGDLLISNEGQDGVPTLLRLDYRGGKIE